MRISTTARHCEIDPEDRLYAEQRLEKLSRFTRKILEAHLVLSAENYRHSAEITLKVNGREMVSREEANVPRTAIAAAADRLEQQIRKLKDRRLERRRAERARAADAPAPPGGIAGEDGDGGFDAGEFDGVARED
jgi:putative sigma-54 modulation protein